MQLAAQLPVVDGVLQTFEPARYVASSPVGAPHVAPPTHSAEVAQSWTDTPTTGSEGQGAVSHEVPGVVPMRVPQQTFPDPHIVPFVHAREMPASPPEDEPPPELAPVS